MHLSDAIREILTNLARVDETTVEGRLAEQQADNILAVVAHNREPAGRTLIAMGSFAAFAWVKEPGRRITPEEAINALDLKPPVPHFREFLEACVKGWRNDQRYTVQAAITSANITLNPTDTALALWILATYIATVAPKTDTDTFFDDFIASSLRQEIIFDVDLERPPEEPTDA